MKTQFLDLNGLGETVEFIKKCIADRKEIFQYASLGLFPLQGITDGIYIDTDANTIYRWDSTNNTYKILAKAINSVSLESGSTNGTIKVVVDGVKSEDVPIKGLGAAAFVDNYAGSSSPGGPATSAQDISSQTPILAVGDESNNISVKKNSNGTFMNGAINVEVKLAVDGKSLKVDNKELTVAQSDSSNKYAMRNALDFAWYKTHWQIGNVRSNSEDSIGFGFTYSNDEGEHFIPKALLSDSGQFVVDSVKANLFTGTLSGSATYASSAPWTGITGKPDSMPASDVFSWAKQATKPKYTYTEVGAAPLEHNHDDRYYTEAEISALLDSKADSSHNHDDIYYTQMKLDELLSKKSDVGHTHTKSEVGLSNVDNTADKDKTVKSAKSADSVVWANITDKPDTYTPSDHSHGISDIINLQATLDNKSNTNHNHDSRYYTETETNNLLKGYMPIDSTVDWSKLTNIPSTFTPAEHTHKYAASDTVGGPATSALMISAQTPLLAQGNESNDISVKQNGNGTFAGRTFKLDIGIVVGGKVVKLSGNAVATTKTTDTSSSYALRNALDFKYYSSHWQIGNVRSNSNDSIGFGFAYSDDGTSFYPKAILTTSGRLSVDSVQANRFDGTLYGNATSADSVPWLGITGKPSTFTPANHTHDDLYYSKSYIDGKLVTYLPLSGGNLTGSLNMLDKNGSPVFSIVNAETDDNITSSAFVMYQNDNRTDSSYSARISYTGDKNVLLTLPDRSGTIAVIDNLTWDSITGTSKPLISRKTDTSNYYTNVSDDMNVEGCLIVNEDFQVKGNLYVDSHYAIYGDENAITDNITRLAKLPAKSGTIAFLDDLVWDNITLKPNISLAEYSSTTGVPFISSGIEIGDNVVITKKLETKGDVTIDSTLYCKNIGDILDPISMIHTNTIYSTSCYAVPKAGSIDVFGSLQCFTDYCILWLKKDDYKVNLYPSTMTNNVSAYLPSTSGTLQVSSSDIRLKKNVKDTTVNGLDMIDKIKLHQFDWRTDGSHQDVGFIADELEELDSRLSVGGNDEVDENGLPTNPKCVNDFYLMGYMVKAMQEMSQKITDLENRLRKEELSC